MRTQLGAVAALTLAGLVLVPAPSDAAATCAGKRVTIHGTAGGDVIRGTSRADVIDGGGGNDVISGLGGNDTICGGEGADDLRGNAGNDRLYGGIDEVYVDGSDQTWHFGDKLRGGAGDDTLVPGLDPRDELHNADDVLYDTAPRGVSVNLATGTATGDGSDRLVFNTRPGLVGSAYADRLVGTDDRDSIAGGPGADRIWGGGGRDLLSPGSGNDQVWAGADDDWVEDSGGDDRLVGGTGNDVLTAEGYGRDTLEGGDGDDRLTDTEPCWVSSQPEYDRLYGQAGDDTLVDTYLLGKACGGTGLLDGGSGADQTDVTALPPTGSTQKVVVSLTGAGTGVIENESGRDLATLASVEVIGPRGLGATVHGSPAADSVVAGLPFFDPATDDFVLTPLTFVAGAGDDNVLVHLDGTVVDVDGQAGTDCLKGTPAASSTLTSVELQPAGPDTCPGWPLPAS